MIDTEIKEAIENIKVVVAKNFTGLHTCSFDKDMQLLLTLAQSYLSASEELPKEKTPEWRDINPETTDTRVLNINCAYNQARQDFILALMKRCEGIEQVIKDYAHYDDDIGVGRYRAIHIYSDGHNLSQAIREHILGGER